jgi:hypothetical protein
VSPKTSGWGPVLKKSSISWWMRLKVHFLLFGITMSILPLFFLGYLGFTSVRQNLQKDIYEQNFEQVTVLADQMKDFFANVENSLTLTKATSIYALVGKDQLSRQNILETLLPKESFVEEIKVADEGFAVIGQIDRQAGIPRSSSLAKIENPLSPDKSSALSDVFFTDDRNPEIYLTVALQEPTTGKRIGYLQAKVDLKRIISRYAKIRLGDGKYVLIVDQAGRLIWTTGSSHVFQPKEIRQDPAVQSFLEGEAFSQGSEYKNPDGLSVIGEYASIGTPNWAIFIEQPASEANKPISEFA